MECLSASNVRTLEPEQYLTISCKVPSGKFWLNQRSITFPRHGHLEFYKPAKLIYHMHQYRRHSSLRTSTETVSLDEDPLAFSPVESINNELDSNNEELLSQKPELLSQKPESNELKSLLADSERGKLLRKLSEANQYNRFLRRQLIAKDDALVNFKSELANSELELKALVGLAEEMAIPGPPIVSRKINGKYITSHLLSRLTAVHEKVKAHMKDFRPSAVHEKVKAHTKDFRPLASHEKVKTHTEDFRQLAVHEKVTAHMKDFRPLAVHEKVKAHTEDFRQLAVHEKVKAHTKDTDSVKVKDIELFWGGMAESVQIMGSFDGWTQGEEMSPEYAGSYTIFSVTMRLRPGRYEIKYLVDGEWQLSPELPTVGEGMLINNLLIVE